MKKCTKCGEEKLFSEFSPDKKTRDRKKSDCKSCRTKTENNRRRLKQGLPLNHVYSRIDNGYKHGLYGTRMYTIWVGIKQRCFNEEHKRFKDYGGRGITIYEPWINNPKLFIEYLKILPGWNNPKLSIDRIKNNEDYKPGNLRFATNIEQNNNRRKFKPRKLCIKKLS